MYSYFNFLEAGAAAATTLSFPRRRESIISIAILRMDSRLRGNDRSGAE